MFGAARFDFDVAYHLAAPRWGQSRAWWVVWPPGVCVSYMIHSQQMRGGDCGLQVKQALPPVWGCCCWKESIFAYAETLRVFIPKGQHGVFKS